MKFKHKNHSRMFILLVIAFLSGLSILVYELSWSRYLNLIFGLSVYAVATVLTCFMLGLAIGSYLIGKFADKTKYSVSILFIIQLVISIYGFLSPLIFSYLSDFNIFLFQNLQLTGFAKHVVRFLMSLIFLLPPTILMGGTFPIYVKLFNKGMRTIGKDVGTIYSLNTLGGAIGAFISGFFLIQFLGISGSIFLNSFINLAIAGAIYFLFNNQTLSKKEIVNKKDKDSVVYPKHLIMLTIIAFAVSGFTSLSYEVFWTKILTLFFRDTIYDFAIVLSAYLTGIFIGSFICSQLLKRIKNLPQTMAFVEIGIGLLSLLCIFFISQLPYIASFLQSMPKMEQMFGESYWMFSIVIRFVYSFIIMLLPTILFGATFPLVSKICINNFQQRAEKSGFLNSMNTIGSALGSFLAGFLFISLLGLQNSIICMAIINILIGLLILAFCAHKNIQIKISIFAAIFVVALIIFFIIPTWDKLNMSTYILEIGQPIHKLLKIDFYNEDAYGITTVVTLTPTKTKYLVTNRLYTQNASSLYGPEDHRRMGHIPMLLSDNPHNVLMIGLGAGITLRGITEIKPVTIDCIEISESVFKANQFFSDVNSDILNNPKINFIIDDGRNYISTTKKKYDVIVADIFFPMSFGSSNLYSKEYFQLSRKRLSDNGLFAAWLPIHQLSFEEIRIIINTFQTVYPYTSVWFGMVGKNTPSIACIGMLKPLRISYEKLMSKLNNPEYKKYLNEVNLSDSVMFLGNFIMDGIKLQDFCYGVPVNTDDKPIIEFLNPLITLKFKDRASVNMEKLLKYKENVFEKGFIY